VEQREPIIQQGGLVRLAGFVVAIIAVSFVVGTLRRLDVGTVLLICIPVIAGSLALAAWLDCRR
jgi:hypothetical protein